MMNDEIKKMLVGFEAELRFAPRFVFATNPVNGDRYRFRFHQLNRAGQSRMASELSKRGLSVRCWGGQLRPEWVNNPRGILQPVSTPASITPARFWGMTYREWFEFLYEFSHAFYTGRLGN